MIIGSASLKNMPATGNDLRQERAVLTHGMQNGQMVLLAELEIVLAVRGRDVDDARAVAGRDEFCGSNPADVASGG